MGPESGSLLAYMDTLNPQQREAVLHHGPPLLILAGAGSGKTRVVTTKIAYLIEQQGYDPVSILAVAFTNKAAEEMKSRLHGLNPAAVGVTVRTFHSFGAWVLRRFGEAIGVPGSFTIYDDQDSLSLLKTVLEDRLPHARLKELAEAVARAKDYCLLPGEVPNAGVGESSARWGSGAAARTLDGLAAERGLQDADFPQAYRLYQERLEASGCLDFGDLIVRSVRLLETVPEVRLRLQRRFRAVLVDEYQDSNYAQFRLLQALYDGTNYLCVVGDEDQSIYSFRGAELANILEFNRQFPGSEIIRLEENYRSTRNILEVAARVVEHNRNRLGKTLRARKGEGAPVVLAQLDTQDEEARFCADALSDGRFDETAILYRMNFQSRVFETLFARLGIPFRVVGTVRFYEREEIKDALAYLGLLANPRDELAFRRAASKPRRGIGARTLDRIAERWIRGGGSLLEAARGALGTLPSRADAALERLITLLDTLGALLDRDPPGSLGEVVRSLVAESGLLELYRERDRGDGTEKVKNLEELVSATAEYSGSREGLYAFLESLALNSTDENPFARTGRVTLITVHNTKGLEFDRVFLTGLEDGIFPHYSSTVGGLTVDGADLEEERRLFYVGATRAREELYLTTCRQRRVFGTLQAREPSRFLMEIPPGALHVYGQRAETDDGFPLGCGVYHDEYGPGIITRKWMAEGQTMVVVSFDSGKSARFPLKYSSLERISRDP
ncbi:MAG: UvrD-helicase domain-containing protein [Spirochaetales bacterium]|nr:UvrD-helicase domain-containing protein [Spirochaetales bacterium]